MDVFGERRVAGRASSRCTQLSTVGDTRYHTPLGRFSKLGYSAPSAIPVPNDTLWGNCRRDLSNHTLFGSDAPFDVE